MSDDLGPLGKLIAVAMSILILNLVGLVAIVVVGVLSWHQSRDNERHIDCIVASAMTPPPDRCAAIIAELRDQGILRLPPTTPQTIDN